MDGRGMNLLSSLQERIKVKRPISSPTQGKGDHTRRIPSHGGEV